MNQTLEQYLRCYINYEQNDWVKWLPIAQIAYKSSDNESIGISLFYANYGFNPDITKTASLGNSAPEATLQVDKIKKLQGSLQQDLTLI